MIIMYGVYLLALGDKHQAEAHLLATRAFICEERFECQFASMAGVAAILAGVAGIIIALRITIA